MKMKLTLFAVGVVSALSAQASVVINNLNDTATIDFTSFTGAGFSPTPTAGQLDSNTWKVAGMSDGTTAFGDTQTSGDFARGSSTGGVTTGGIYSFDVGAGNFALGVQPGGSDFTPGSLTLRIQNNTGAAVSSWNLSYALFVFNDQGRSGTWNWDWSTDDSTYTSLSTYTSVETADGSPAWSNVQSPSTSGLNANVANGGFLYLKWSGDDAAGSGSRDEFAIDNISITAIPEPSTALLGAIGALALLRRRRR